MTVLRKCRKDRGLTLEIVATEIGTDAGNLSRIERGRQFPGRELARELASYYGLSIEQVLYPEAEEATA